MKDLQQKIQGVNVLEPLQGTCPAVSETDRDDGADTWRAAVPVKVNCSEFAAEVENAASVLKTVYSGDRLIKLGYDVADIARAKSQVINEINEKATSLYECEGQDAAEVNPKALRLW